MGREKETESFAKICKPRQKGPHTKKKHASRVTIYLMNERELVQSALAFAGVDDRISMPEMHSNEEPNEDGPLTERKFEAMENSESDTPEVLHGIGVTDSLFDAAVAETIPYLPCDPREKLVDGNSTSTSAQIPVTVADDDDALKLVKEIFFT